jgi:hypothetical protein
MNVADLAAQLHDSDGVAAEVLMALLRFCSAHKTELDQQTLHRAGRQAVDNVCIEAADWIGQDSTLFAPEALQRVLDTVEASTEPAVTARGLLEAVYLHYRHQVDAFAVALADGVLAIGAPLHTPVPDLRLRFPAHQHYTTSQFDLPHVFDNDALPTVRLVTADLVTTVQVRRDRTAGAYLDEVVATGPFDVAAARTNMLLQEFSIARDGTRVGPVTLLDPTAQTSLAQQIVARAHREGVSVLVLPELSRDPACSADILDAICAGPAPGLVHAGSAHEHDGDRLVNRAVLVYTGPSHRVPQDKIVPATYARRTGTAGRVQESIDGGSELILHAGRNCSLVAVTCADLLEESVLALVSKLRPHIVLVAAMSDKLSGFTSAVARLVQDAQSIVVVANNVRSWPAGNVEAAVFGRPLEPVQTLVVDGSEVPALTVLRAAEDLPRDITDLSA